MIHFCRHSGCIHTWNSLFHYRLLNCREIKMVEFPLFPPPERGSQEKHQNFRLENGRNMFIVNAFILLRKDKNRLLQAHPWIEAGLTILAPGIGAPWAFLPSSRTSTACAQNSFDESPYGPIRKIFSSLFFQMSGLSIFFSLRTFGCLIDTAQCIQATGIANVRQELWNHLDEKRLIVSNPLLVQRNNLILSIA